LIKIKKRRPKKKSLGEVEPGYSKVDGRFLTPTPYLAALITPLGRALPDDTFAAP
jgi:hypothetical protein